MAKKTLYEFSKETGVSAVGIRHYMEEYVDSSHAKFYGKYMVYGEEEDGSDTYLDVRALNQLNKDFKKDEFLKEYKKEFPEFALDGEEVDEPEVSEEPKEEPVKESAEDKRQAFLKFKKKAEEKPEETTKEATPETTEEVAEETTEEPAEETEEVETTEDTEEVTEEVAEEVKEDIPDDFINAPEEPEKEEVKEVKEEPVKKAKKEKETVKVAEKKETKKKNKLAPPKEYFKDLAGTADVNTVFARKFLVDSNTSTLEEVAFATDDEINDLFTDNFIQFRVADSVLVIKKEVLEENRDSIYLINS